MENNFNKSQEESTAGASEWESLANVPFNDGETEAKAPERLSKKLEASIASIDDALDTIRDNVSQESYWAVAKARIAVEKELNKALYDEALEALPEENRGTLEDMVNHSDERMGTDYIIKAINMNTDGKPMEEIRDYIVRKEWSHAPIDSEENIRRGEVIYNQFLDLITPKSTE